MQNRFVLRRRALLQGSAVVAAAAAIELTSGGRPAFAAGELPATVQSVQDSRYSAINTTYGTAAVDPALYAHCEVVFVAPPSGRAIIHWSGALRNLSDSESPVAYLSPEVRAGATPGSGTVVLPPADVRTVRCNFAGAIQTVRAGASHMLSGLTPGATYNARILHRVTSSTGEFFFRSLIVAPTS
jgi:hypothetical protein